MGKTMNDLKNSKNEELIKTQFLDYDAREETRIKSNPNKFAICIKCQKLIRGKPKYYLCFLKSEWRTRYDGLDGVFPFMIHPLETYKINDNHLEFLPIGSNCIKEVGKEWAFIKDKKGVYCWSIK
jgi:hypothetical protein